MKPITDKKLLQLWGAAVIERAGHRCEYPDCSVHYTQLHPHHFYSRRGVSMRYNLKNGLALCPYHHTMGSFAAHSDPDFKDRIISTGVRSQQWHFELLIERNQIQKNTPAFKDECFEKLKLYLNC